MRLLPCRRHEDVSPENCDIDFDPDLPDAPATPDTPQIQGGPPDGMTPPTRGAPTNMNDGASYREIDPDLPDANRFADGSGHRDPMGGHRGLSNWGTIPSRPSGAHGPSVCEGGRHVESFSDYIAPHVF